MGGLARPRPVYAAALRLLHPGRVGLPGLAGFVGEFLVFSGTFAFSPWSRPSRPSSWSSAAAYLLWMYQRVVFGELSGLPHGPRAPPHRHDARSRS